MSMLRIKRRSIAIVIIMLLGVIGGSVVKIRRVLPVYAAQVLPTRRQRDEAEIQMEKARVKQVNKERQAAIKKDTDKLLKLATELKQYVDKSNENTLSMDVVKKAAEIEKLAKTVKERMREGY